MKAGQVISGEGSSNKSLYWASIWTKDRSSLCYDARLQTRQQQQLLFWEFHFAQNSQSQSLQHDQCNSEQLTLCSIQWGLWNLDPSCYFGFPVKKIRPILFPKRRKCCDPGTEVLLSIRKYSMVCTGIWSWMVARNWGETGDLKMGKPPLRPPHCTASLYLLGEIIDISHFTKTKKYTHTTFTKGSAYCTKLVLCNSSLMHKTLPFYSLSFHQNWGKVCCLQC